MMPDPETIPQTETASLPRDSSGSVPSSAVSDTVFVAALALLGGSYVLLILSALLADVLFVSPMDVGRILRSPEIAYATRLSIASSTITTVLALWVAIPLGYLLSRFTFPGRVLVDTLLDIPIVLPPLVIGVSLLILFRTAPGQWVEDWASGLASWWLGRPTRGIIYAVPGVILAQFMVAAAFAVRTMRTTFDEISPRKEQVASTLGCSRAQAFWRIVLPEAWRGVLAAAALTWARAIGEFGPILVFAGATQFRTEVLPTSVFLHISVGDVEGAVAVSLVMVAMAFLVLVVLRLLGGGVMPGGFSGRTA